MEAGEILAQAKARNEATDNWIILPLIRSKVATGIVGWTLGILLGLGLFLLVSLATIPHNYQIGVGAAIFTTALLLVLLFIGLGSTWSLIMDVRRFINADNYMIVITPEDFLKQEGEKIILVPLTDVRHVTARGTPPPDRTPSSGSAMNEIPRAGDNVLGFVFGRGMVPSGMNQRRKRMRTPTTLAFVDTRTDCEIVVATDSSYGDPFMIAALLKQYAARVQHIA